VVGCGLRGKDCVDLYLVCRLGFLEHEGGFLGCLLSLISLGGGVLGVPLGFLEVVLPSGSSSLSSLLPEMVSLRSEPTRSVSESL